MKTMILTFLFCACLASAAMDSFAATYSESGAKKYVFALYSSQNSKGFPRLYEGDEFKAIASGCARFDEGNIMGVEKRVRRGCEDLKGTCYKIAYLPGNTQDMPVTYVKKYGAKHLSFMRNYEGSYRGIVQSFLELAPKLTDKDVAAILFSFSGPLQQHAWKDGKSEGDYAYAFARMATLGGKHINHDLDLALFVFGELKKYEEQKVSVSAEVKAMVDALFTNETDAFMSALPNGKAVIKDMGKWCIASGFSSEDPQESQTDRRRK